MTDEEFISLPDAAQLLFVSRSHVAKLVSSGMFTTRQDGALRRSDVLEYVRACPSLTTMLSRIMRVTVPLCLRPINTVKAGPSSSSVLYLSEHIASRHRISSNKVKGGPSRVTEPMTAHKRVIALASSPYSPA